MATQAQVTANRINAQASTGPSSPAGIAVAKFNATRHGLSGSQVVVKGEDPAAFDALRAQLLTEHAPASEREAMLVDEIAQNWWRLQRARRTEAHLINHYGMVHCLTEPETAATFKNVTRYLNSIERSWRKACLELEKLQQSRASEMNDAQPAANSSEMQNEPKLEPKPQPCATPRPANRLRFVERLESSGNPDPNVLISDPAIC